MKKILLMLVPAVLTLNTFSQTIHPTYPKNHYQQKSKHQKTAAWILLSGGTIMAVAGGISFSSNWDLGSNSATDVSGFIMLGGIIADIVSIPFFVSAAKNKRKAAAIVFNPQNNYMIVQNRVLKIQPGISLKIGC